MNPSIATYLVENKKVTAVLFGGLGLILLLFIIAALISPRYGDYSLREIPLKNGENFSYLSGNELYAYNGLAFYKLNLTTPDSVTILSSGTKLPSPQSVFWASSKGALVTFDSSFTVTQVADKLRQRGEELDEFTEAYTWYVDFEDGSLHLVDEVPPRPFAAYYSEAENGFYYVPDFSGIELENPAQRPLYFYSLDDNKRSLAVKDLGAIDISYLGACPKTEQKACVVSRDPDNLEVHKLQAVTKDGKLETILENEGRIIATNLPDTFVTTTKQVDEGDGEFVEVEATPASLNNLVSGQVMPLDFKVGSETIAVNILSEDKFYVLSAATAGIDQQGTYLSGASDVFNKLNTEERPLLIGDDPYIGGLLGQVSYGTNGTTLINSVEADQYLFAPVDSPVAVTAMEQNAVQQVINDCVNAHARNSQYFQDSSLYRIFFTDNNQFSSRVADFTQCIVDREPSVMVGYNFYFGGLSPVNGRITTD